MVLTALALAAPARTAAAASPPAIPMAAPPAAPTVGSPALTADLGWTPPYTLEAQSPTNANLGSVALSGNGNGTIVWEKDGLRTTIMATPFRPGHGADGSDWEAPVALTTGGCNNYAPTVAMDRSGDAIAVWYDTCNYAIHASVFRPASGWTVPVGIDQPYWLSVNPQIAMNEAGTAFVTWEAWDGSTYHVFANRYVPGTGWGTAIRLDPSANYTSGTNVAVDGSGNAIATWYRYDGGTYHVLAARFDLALGWLAPILIESSTNYAVYPNVAMDGLGNAFVAWTEWDGVYNIWANRYDHATGWTGAVNIESQGFQASGGPRVAANNGNAAVVWTMYGPGTDPYSVWANRYVSGVGWGTEADVDGFVGPSYGASYANVVLDQRGNATIIYQILYLTSTPANQAQTYALRYNTTTGAASGWTPLDFSRVSPGAAVLAIDTAGNALAAWNYNDNPDTTTPARNGILSNRYTIGSGWRYYGAQQAEWDENLRPAWLQLESNTAGDAIYSWTQDDGPIWNGYAALYTPTLGWGPATKIENLDFTSVAEEWSAIDGQGNAIVLFKTSNGTQYNVYATYYSVRTGWGTPQMLEGLLGSSKYWLRVAMNRNGDGIAIWEWYNGTAYNAYSDRFNGTTQTWEGPVVVQTAVPYMDAVVVGIDGSGNAMAVFQAWNGTATNIYASYGPAGAAWDAPVRISQSTLYPNSPYAVAMNDQGDVAVSWNEWQGSRWDAVANTFTPAGGWGTATVLSSGPGDGDPAIPSVDGAGNVMVAYQLFDGAQWDVYAVTKPAGAAWGTPERLNGGTGDATDIVSALDFRGNGYAAWVQYNGYGYDILARRYVAGQGWLPVAVINSPAPATPSTNTGSTNLAVDGHGNALLGWNQWQRSVLVPYAAEYIVGDGHPDLSLSSPAAGLLTRSPSVTVSGMTDPGATVAIDGASTPVGPDGSFSRSYSVADGTHTFIVVASNAAGLTTTESRSVTVDTIAPALSLLGPSTGTLTNNPVAQVTGTTEAGAMVDVNGVNAAVSPTGQFSVSIPLQEGANTITATATDSVGNSASRSVQVTLDTRAPSLSVSSPTPGLTNHAAVVVAGSTEPGATLTVDGTAVSVDSSGAFSTTRSLTDGAHTIRVVATDAAGNQAATSVQVTVDTTAPAISITSPSAGTNVTSPIVTVTGTTEAGATVVVNGYAVSAGPAGAFSLGLPLSAGANTITATATDAAGNSASTSIVVTYTDPLPAAQSSIASLNTMNLLLIVLVVVSLAIGVFEMLQIRKLRGGGNEPPRQKPGGPPPPNEEL